MISGFEFVGIATKGYKPVGYYVYIAVCEDEVIYVGKGNSIRWTHCINGKSDNVELNRLFFESKYVSVFILADQLLSSVALDLELAYIRKLKPKFNRVGVECMPTCPLCAANLLKEVDEGTVDEVTKSVNEFIKSLGKEQPYFRFPELLSFIESNLYIVSHNELSRILKEVGYVSTRLRGTTTGIFWHPTYFNIKAIKDKPNEYDQMIDDFFSIKSEDYRFSMKELVLFCKSCNIKYPNEKILNNKLLELGFSSGRVDIGKIEGVTKREYIWAKSTAKRRPDFSTEERQRFVTVFKQTA
jgi:hypothetical protein